MAYRIKIEKQGTPYPYDIKDQDGSLAPLPEISTKIKPINKEKANSEIEKGEIVLDPDTGALHKALGKPHSKGGTPVSLKDGSFVFSNYKPLAIKKDEKELFEFKTGGKYKPANNTPSKVLEKEVDIEHHNKMINILVNEKSNTTESVNSAKLMMLKNLEKAGQVAYLQESKKDAEIPGFASTTAPIYSQQTDEQINQSMQYMQKGGYTLPQYQTGNRKPTDAEILLAQQNLLKDPRGWNLLGKYGNKTYYNKPGYNKPATGNQSSFNQWFAKQSPAFQADYKQRSMQAMKNKAVQFGYMKENIDAPLPRTPIPRFDNMSPAAVLKPFNRPSPGAQVGNAAGNPNGIVDPTTYDSKLSLLQKFNIGYPFAKALNVKTQYPLRQHQESVIPQMENISSQPQENAINQSYFNVAKNLDSSQMQEAYGNRIGALGQAIGNTQNANVQTQNNQKIMAANSLNQDAAANRQFDKEYKEKTDTAILNTRDLKEAYTNQGINNLNTTMEKKLAFDSWLNSQQQFKGKPTYVDQDGVQHYEGQSLYTPKAGIWGNTVQYNAPNIDWSTYQSSQTSMEDDDNAYVRNIRQLLPGMSEDKIGDLLRERTRKKSLAAYTAANMQTNNLPQSFKMGGKYRKKSC